METLPVLHSTVSPIAGMDTLPVLHSTVSPVAGMDTLPVLRSTVSPIAGMDTKFHNIAGMDAVSVSQHYTF